MNLFFVSIIQVRHGPEPRTVFYRYKDLSFSIFNQPLQVEDMVTMCHLNRVLNKYGQLLKLPWVDEVVAKLDVHMNPKGQSIVEFEESYEEKGLLFFDGLFRAITGRKVVNLLYRRFHEKAKYHLLIPRYLRQFDRRWYLLASYPRKPKDIYFFALDRIDSYEVDCSTPYVDSDIDVREYFYHIYGITKPKGAEPVDILFYVAQDELGYVLTNPLHHSQKVVRNLDDGVIMSIHVIQNTELLLRFMSYGEKVIVLSKCELRKQIIEKLHEELLKYQTTR